MQTCYVGSSSLYGLGAGWSVLQNKNQQILSRKYNARRQARHCIGSKREFDCKFLLWQNAGLLDVILKFLPGHRPGNFSQNL